jgi:hypothetical protein
MIEKALNLLANGIDEANQEQRADQEQAEIWMDRASSRLADEGRPEAKTVSAALDCLRLFDPEGTRRMLKAALNSLGLAGSLGPISKTVFQPNVSELEGSADITLDSRSQQRSRISLTAVPTMSSVDERKSES